MNHAVELDVKLKSRGDWNVLPNDWILPSLLTKESLKYQD